MCIQVAVMGGREGSVLNQKAVDLGLAAGRLAQHHRPTVSQAKDPLWGQCDRLGKHQHMKGLE